MRALQSPCIPGPHCSWVPTPAAHYFELSLCDVVPVFPQDSTSSLGSGEFTGVKELDDISQEIAQLQRCAGPNPGGYRSTPVASVPSHT